MHSSFFILHSAFLRSHRSLALLAFSLLSIVWTWPLAARLASRVPHDPGDPVFNIFILWWNAQAVPLTAGWWNAPFYFPMEGALAFSEHLLGISAFTTPLIAAGASPVAAYNVAMLLSFVLSGFFAYLLAHRLTGSAVVAFCAGMAFAFAPYRASQLAHLQVLTAQWIPAMLLGMHAYVETGRRRWLVLFGLAWLLQALSNGYYMLFVPVLVVLWLAWFTDWRAPRRSAELLAAWALASLPLLPVVLKYHAVHSSQGLERGLEEIRDYSATFESFVTPPWLLKFWNPSRDAIGEGYLFPGGTVLALTAAGVLALLLRKGRLRAVRERSPLLFYTGAAVSIFLLTLGPGGEPDGPPSLLRPYSWLLWLPGYEGLRVPSRFAMLGALCLAVSAALALPVLFRRSRRWRAAFASLAIVGAGIDGFLESMPLYPPPQRLFFEVPAGAAVIELPPEDHHLNIAAMYRSSFYEQVLVNGYSGYTPYHYAILTRSLWRGDTSVLSYLAQHRPLAIVVTSELNRGSRFRRIVPGIPGVETVGSSGPATMFFMPRQPPRPQPVEDRPVPAVLRDEPQRTQRRVVADLGEPRIVTGFAFDMRARFRDVPQRVLIEASNDGREWREVWVGWTGEFMLDAVLRDAVVAHVRVPIPATLTRFVRIYPTAPWMLEELELVGQ